MIIGHKNQWDFLIRSAELSRLSHAYLFFGQEKLGKKALAVDFIKYLNCQSPKKPCSDCKNCRDIEKGLYPDFILVEPEKKKIQISQIRELINKLSLRSYFSGFKTAILDRVHLMNQESQNCFLKLLEEPKGETILILVTEYPQLLLPTILSRVQRIRFSPVKVKEIENYLLEKGASPKQAEDLSLASFGRPGLALDFLSQPRRIEEQKKLAADLFKLADSDLAFRFQYAKEISIKPDSAGLKKILDIWLNLFRRVLLLRMEGSESDDFKEYSLNKLRKIISLIQSTNFLLSTTNINSRLALETLFLEI